MGMLACTDIFLSDGTTDMSKKGHRPGLRMSVAARELLCSEVPRGLIQHCYTTLERRNGHACIKQHSAPKEEL